jgi:hypothetical protein
VGNHPTAAAVPDHVTEVPGDVLNPVSDVGVLGRETDTVGRGLGTADEKGQNPGINLGGLALSLVIGKVKGKRKNLVKKMRSKKMRSKKKRSKKMRSKKMRSKKKRLKKKRSKKMRSKKKTLLRYRSYIT